MATAEPGPPELRPLRIGEILDVSVKIFTRNAGTLFKIVAIVVIPVQALGVLLILSTVPDSLAGLGTDPFSTDPATQVPQFDPGEIGIFLAANGVVLLLGLVSTALATGAAFKAVSNAYLGAPTDWRSSLRFALSRLHSIVWISLLYTLIPSVGLFLCIVPGVWLWAAWGVATPVLLTEGAKGTKALGRSFGLVQRLWWPTFAVLLLAALFAFIVTSIVTGFVSALSFTDLGQNIVLIQIFNGIAGAIAAVIATPFQAAVVTILYFDLRVRKEGFDLALLAQRIGADLEGEARAALIPPPVPPPMYAPAGDPAQAGGVVPYAPQPTNGKSTAALIFGILGLTCLPGVGGIVGLILGYSAKAEIAREPAQQGRGNAIAGIVMGWVAVAFLALFVIVTIAS